MKSLSNMLNLHIAQVNTVLFDGEVESVTLPGSDGELTVLGQHEPLITTLKEGTITVRPHGSSEQTFSITRGILEVSDNKAVVLV